MIARQMRLRDRVAAVDFLSRLGRPEVASRERAAALRGASRRSRTARGWPRCSRVAQQMAAARRLMERDVGAGARRGYARRRARFVDRARSTSSRRFVLSPGSLMATLAIDPEHALVGPLAETLAQQGRAERRRGCGTRRTTRLPSTALAALDRRRRAAGRAHGSRAERKSRDPAGQHRCDGGRDSTISLAGLVPNGSRRASAPPLARCRSRRRELSTTTSP